MLSILAKNFSCSFKYRSGESKPINNHDYQIYLNTAYWASQRVFLNLHTECTDLKSNLNNNLFGIICDIGLVVENGILLIKLEGKL